MATLRDAILIILAIGAFLVFLSRPTATGQSQSFPVGQGYDSTDKKYVPIQVDANGVVQTN